MAAYERYIAEDGLPRIIRPPNAKPLNRHPALQDKVKGIWYPCLVGVVPHYPETLEEYRAVQEASSKRIRRLIELKKWGCQGVPPGWAGKKKLLAKIRREGATRANKIVKKMIEQGKITKEGEMAEVALAAAVEIVITREEPAPTEHEARPTSKYLYTTRDRLAALKTVLEFTKTKPVVKTENQFSLAETWLDSIKED
ncbi:hypothetical protein [Asaia prunellae]|uniref:hypothetical protein n=1 Tax=Asaia prunellae TaxID=610245 RepID=UPI00046E66A6|nr:hypothetical protein [Asaia prunellae]